MIKLLLGGIWICAVTASSVYMASSWRTGATVAASGEPYMQGLDYEKTRQITVPKISGGGIQGYVVAQFVFTADAGTLRKLAVPPEVFVVDEAFRAIYEDDEIDFDNLEKQDLSALTTMITERVNARVQSDLVQETLVEQFDYFVHGQIEGQPLAPSQRAPAGAGTGQPAH